ncbi:uncharacterized protein LOC117327788 [Pecten maximus]|uniref:uncharacterized protein LOC117327788 n=1 Tax=Pecten maximus TaxID=6579 RepID=UPI00145881A4|nr:uncharacterized protein LOC117327788 [Pecten maximus]
MSTNGTTPAAESDAVVLSGGVIFIIIFGATSIFFFSIMTVVCVGEFKEYRSRRRRPSGPIENGNYPRQPPPLTVPPVTNPTVAGANYPRQPPDSGADNHHDNISTVKPVEETVASGQSDAENKSVIVSKEGKEGSSTNGDIIVLHQTPRKKHSQLKPLELTKPGTQSSNPETIFSPRPITDDGVTTVAFIQPTPPLPSISSNISQSDVTPVVSS